MRSFRCTLIKRLFFFSKRNASSGGYSFDYRTPWPRFYVVLIFFVLARSVRSSPHWAYAIIVFGLLGWTLTLYLIFLSLLTILFLILVGRTNYTFGVLCRWGLPLFLFFPSRTPWIPGFSLLLCHFSLFIFSSPSSSIIFDSLIHDFRRIHIQFLKSLLDLYGIHMFGFGVLPIALGAVSLFSSPDSIDALSIRILCLFR